MPDGPYLDANVLLRLLLNDVPDQAESVAALLRESGTSTTRPRLSAVTLAEIVFVLGGAVYRNERGQIAAAIDVILGLPVVVEDREIVEQALTTYRDVHPGWEDAFLAACALTRSDGRVVTFDHQLARVPGVKATDPTGRLTP